MPWHQKVVYRNNSINRKKGRGVWFLNGNYREGDAEGEPTIIVEISLYGLCIYPARELWICFIPCSKLSLSSNNNPNIASRFIEEIVRWLVDHKKWRYQFKGRERKREIRLCKVALFSQSYPHSHLHLLALLLIIISLKFFSE